MFWAQKVDYLKNYITYEGKVLEGLYLCFFGSEFFFFCQNWCNNKEVNQPL